VASIQGVATIQRVATIQGVTFNQVNTVYVQQGHIVDVFIILKVLQAIEAENQQLVVSEAPGSPTLHQKPPEDYSEESPTHKNDESSATPSMSSTKLHTSRSLVNFVAAKQQAINRKAAAKTKKRGEARD